MREYFENDRWIGSFEPELRGGDDNGDGALLLVYRVIGDMGEGAPLSWELGRAVERDVAAHRPRNVAFDLTWVDCLYDGAPVEFLVRPCHPVRERGGRVFIVLGPHHLPHVRRILTLCRIIPGPETTGYVQCRESVEAVEAAIAGTDRGSERAG